MNNKKNIDLAPKESNSKKKFHEEIFMPKFFLNLINLAKKAEKLRKKLNKPVNQDLVLDFKTSFSHMPKIHFLSCKSSSKNKLDYSEKNLNKRYNNILNSPERVLIKPSLPKINNKIVSSSSDSKDREYINNLNVNNIKKKEDCFKVYPMKIRKQQIKLNKNKSYIIINFNRNKHLISNSSLSQKSKCNFETSKNNYSHISNINNNKDNAAKTEKNNNTINIHNININDINLNNINVNNNIKPIHNINNLFINNYMESYIKYKFKERKIISTRKTPKYNKRNYTNVNLNSNTNNTNNNNININETYFQKEHKKKKINSSVPKNNINFSFKTLESLPSNFKKKENIINKYLNSLYIEYSFNLNSPLNNSSNNIYYFNISKMYRKQMIEYMKHRINWKHIEYSSLNNMPNTPKNNNININFEWKYYSNRLNYKKYKYSSNIPNKKLRMINLFEKNYEIGNKKNMFLNLMSYCDEIKYNIFDIVPFTMILSNTKDIDLALNSLKEIIEFLEENKNTNKNIIINKLYQEHFGYDKNFEKISEQIIYFDKNFISDKNYWILKPTDMYQGKYIEISNKYDDICRKCLNMFKGVNSNLFKEIMEIEEENQKNENNITTTNIRKKLNIKKPAISKMYCCSDIIIQKYLDNPLLYKKRKFDIRCFALLDCNLNVYYCKEGHLKGSSELYNVENSNKFIHITNYSFQKKSSSFERYEHGNEISYENFKEFLKEEGIPLDKFNKMIEDMKFLIKLSFKSVSKKLYRTNDVLCFELFGYDFIIDNEFKPWILEINNNPGLGISSPVIKKIIPRMIDDAFRLTIDKVFDTKYNDECFDEEGKYKTRFPIEGYKNDENIFEFLCNIK